MHIVTCTQMFGEMRSLLPDENSLPLEVWRETDFSEEIPPAAMNALAAYYELARKEDRDGILLMISTHPALSGPTHVLFQLDGDHVQVLDHGGDTDPGMIRAIAKIIETELRFSEDGARRYTVSAGCLCDVTILPLLRNAGLCLAVVA